MNWLCNNHVSKFFVNLFISFWIDAFWFLKFSSIVLNQLIKSLLIFFIVFRIKFIRWGFCFPVCYLLYKTCVAYFNMLNNRPIINNVVLFNTNKFIIKLIIFRIVVIIFHFWVIIFIILNHYRINKLSVNKYNNITQKLNL